MFGLIQNSELNTSGTTTISMTISDIYTEARELCDATSNDLTDATLLRRVNNAYEEVVGDLINSDGTWQFDDTNYTTLPIGKVTLIEGQTSYSFTQQFLDILWIKIKNSNGVKEIIKPIDQVDLGDMSIEEYFNISDSSTQTGMPTHYDKWEDTIKLYPAPTSTNVTLTNGMEVGFKRTADLFTSAEASTGTKQPGFASPWHQILAYKAALPYCQSYKKDRVAFLVNEINRMRTELMDHYGHREKDHRDRLTMRRINFR